MNACVNYLHSSKLDLPIGLINRLLLLDAAFVDQFVQSSRSEVRYSRRYLH